MKQNTVLATRRLHLSRGFSAVELLVSLAVILIASAIAVPAIMTNLRFYQLSDSATRLAGIIRFTRFEAIRQNKTVACQFQQSGANWTVWADSIANAQPDPTEVQVVIAGTYTLLPANASPDPAGLGIANLKVLSGANNGIPFDARGAVNFGATPPAVYVLYIGSSTDPSLGYRAVIVMPSGATQVWASSASADWRRIS